MKPHEYMAGRDEVAQTLIENVASRLPAVFRFRGHPHADPSRLYRLDVTRSGYRDGGVRCHVDVMIGGRWEPWRDDVALQEFEFFAVGLRKPPGYNHGRSP